MSKETKFLFVSTVHPGDDLSDIKEAVTEIANRFACRCVFWIGTIVGQDETQPEPVHEQRPATNNHQSAVLPAGLSRRRVGGKTIVAGENYPEPDDLTAVTLAIRAALPTAGTVMLINPNYGEYAIAAYQGCPSGSVVYCISDMAFMNRIPIFSQNIAPYDGGIRVVNEQQIEGVDSQQVDALIFVDPRPDDFARYSKHLRYGGILILASTNGASPDLPEKIAHRCTKQTDGVFICHRRQDAVSPENEPETVESNSQPVE